MNPPPTLAAFQQVFAQALLGTGPGPRALARQPGFAVYRNNVVVGLIVLYGVNHFGYLFGFQHVPITIGTGLIIGLFGLPGVVLVTLYYTFF